MNNYYRYLAEFATGDARSTSAEDTRVGNAEATEVVERDLAVTQPTRLGNTLNVSVFQSEVLQDPDEAGKMAPVAFDVEAIPLMLQQRI